MRILILAENYSRPDGFVALHYIHSRNKIYVNNGIDVSVISFKAEKNYSIDGVKVYTFDSYEEKLKDEKYDILISHAPNLKNHYRFLRKYGERYDNIIFFFHGHEVLRTSEIYPKPYYFNKNNKFMVRLMIDLYDRFKLRIWKKYFEKIAYKSHFIFVSNWMYEKFLEFVKINPEIIDNKHIIYNCIGAEFESVSYEINTPKTYDFITIRNNLDGSKYGIDLVTNLAENNPNYSFCVVGKGKIFEYIKKPQNLEWIDKNLSHEEILKYLNQSKCALIPTRADAQGVMACEMATFGMPVITSNIDVCNEIFDSFNNVGYIDNENANINIEPLYKKLIGVKFKEKNNKYFAKNTIGKEVELFKEISKRKYSDG